MSVTYIYVNLVLPVVSWVGLLIAVPYALAHTAVPLMGKISAAKIIKYTRLSYWGLILKVEIWRPK